MDELEISGKRYISTRRAAKENKYHSDYIGQLIRAGKVEGQKVGRSWYVVADSLTEYLGKENSIKTPIVRSATPIAEPKKEAETPAEKPLEEKIEVMEEIIEEKKVEEVDTEDIKEKEAEHHITLKISKPIEKKEFPIIKASHSSLRYLADDGPLYPHIKRPVERVIAEEAEYVEEEAPIFIVEKPQRIRSTSGNWILKGGAVLAIGAITFAIIAGASAFVVSTTTVQGETASVTYSLGGV